MSNTSTTDGDIADLISEAQSTPSKNTTVSTPKNDVPSVLKNEVPNAPKKQKDIFEMTQWFPMAHWEVKDYPGNCEICRNDIMDICVDCYKITDETKIASVKTDKSDKPKTDNLCHLQQGTCGHVFHKHCVDRWLTSNKNCPTDSKSWKVKDGFEAFSFNIE